MCMCIQSIPFLEMRALRIKTSPHNNSMQQGNYDPYYTGHYVCKMCFVNPMEDILRATYTQLVFVFAYNITPVCSVLYTQRFLPGWIRTRKRFTYGRLISEDVTVEGMSLHQARSIRCTNTSMC